MIWGYPHFRNPILEKVERRFRTFAEPPFSFFFRGVRTTFPSRTLALHCTKQAGRLVPCTDPDRSWQIHAMPCQFRGQNFGNGFYNDHHFHYGYFIYSAAVPRLSGVSQWNLWPWPDIWGLGEVPSRLGLSTDKIASGSLSTYENHGAGTSMM